MVVGTDGVARTLYDDIFELGFIQAVSRPAEHRGPEADGMIRYKPRNYLIFYNDGRGTPSSNKFFQIQIGDGSLKKGSGNATGVSLLSEIDTRLSDAVVENGNNFTVTYMTKLTETGALNVENFVHFFIVGEITHTIYDQNGDLTSGANSLNDPDKATITEAVQILQIRKVFEQRTF